MHQTYHIVKLISFPRDLNQTTEHKLIRFLSRGDANISKQKRPKKIKIFYFPSSAAAAELKRAMFWELFVLFVIGSLLIWGGSNTGLIIMTFIFLHRTPLFLLSFVIACQQDTRWFVAMPWTFNNFELTNFEVDISKIQFMRLFLSMWQIFPDVDVR